MGKKKIIAPLPELSDGTTLVDSHCHLDMAAYADDLEEVLKRSRLAGVSRIITVGIELESSRQAVALARRFPGLSATVGVHPHNIMGVTDRQYEELAALAQEPEVVAWGEIGMDLVRQYAPADLQKEHFLRQILMAKELALPLIIHDRAAHNDIMEILRREAPYPAGGVMHCFSGDTILARQVIELGFFISIPGVVTYNRAELLEAVVSEVPLSKLLLETDGPYLTPSPLRGKRNEPAFLLYTAQQVADFKQVSLNEVARQTTANAAALFSRQR